MPEFQPIPIRRQIEAQQPELSSSEKEVVHPASIVMPHILEKSKLLRKDFLDALKEAREFADEYGSEVYWRTNENVQNIFRAGTENVFSALESVDSPEDISRLSFTLEFFLRRGARDGDIQFDLLESFDRAAEIYPKLALSIQSGNMPPLFVALNIGRYGTSEQAVKANAFLAAQLPAMTRYTQQESAMDMYLTSVIEHLLNQGTSEEHVAAKEFILNLLNQADGTRSIGFDMFDSIYGRGSRELQNELRLLLGEVLSSIGLVKEDMESWISEWSKYPDGIVIGKNANALIALERAQPGAYALLAERFGIRHFGRYPTEMLLKQLQDLENQEQPYGIVVYPHDDWNGAFMTNRNIIGAWHNQMQSAPELQKYLIRIFECGSKKEVAQRLIGLNRQYGERHKISFAVIGGHGTKDSIELGEGTSRTQLRSSDLRSTQVDPLRGFFEPNATIVLVACSTGQNEGIGRTLSDKFGMTVIAPKIAKNISKLSAKWENGKIALYAEYFDKKIKAVYGRQSKSS